MPRSTLESVAETLDEDAYSGGERADERAEVNDGERAPTAADDTIESEGEPVDTADAALVATTSTGALAFAPDEPDSAIIDSTSDEAAGFPVAEDAEAPETVDTAAPEAAPPVEIATPEAPTSPPRPPEPSYADPLGVLLADPDARTDQDRLWNILRAPCRNQFDLLRRAAAYVAVGYRARPTRHQEADHNNRTVDDIFTSGWASCGDRDHLLQHFFTRASAPCRRIGFRNAPVQVAHTATEVFLAGEWRFFDATAGMYFSRRGSDVPISLAEARTLYPDIQVWRTRGDVFSGWARNALGLDVGWRGADLSPVTDAEGYPFFFPKETYFLSPATGADVAAYDDFDLAIELDGVDEVQFGSPFDPYDIGRTVDGPSGPQMPQMLERIGKVGAGNVRHSFHVIARERRPVRLTVALADGQDASGLELQVHPSVTTEMLTPPDIGARLAARLHGGGGRFAVFEAHVIPPLTRFVVSAPWGLEGYVRYYRFTAGDPTRAPAPVPLAPQPAPPPVVDARCRRRLPCRGGNG